MPFLGIIWIFAKNAISGILNFLGWCVKNWKIVLPIIVVAALAFYIWHLNREVTKAQAEVQKDVQIIAEWNTKFDKLKIEYDDTVKTCKATIDDQNKHVEEVAKQAETFKKQAKQAAQASEQIKKDSDKRIQDILNGPKPIDCSHTLQYLIDHAKNDKWEENP